MTKHITVKLTEDQYFELYGILRDYREHTVLSAGSKAFVTRLMTKLAKAKNE